MRDKLQQSVPEGYLPRVVVKFDDAVDLPYADDIGPEIETRGIGSWGRLVHQFPGIRLSRLFRSVEPQKIKERMAQAAADRAFKRRNLLAYFLIDCPDSVDPFAVVEELRTWPSVEAAYVDTVTARPQRCDTSYQRGPTDVPGGGVNASAVALTTGATGAGQTLIDLEHQWNGNHQALIGRPGIMPPLFGESEDDTSHGTSVLGIICGVDGSFTGIVPNLLDVHVVSSKPTKVNPSDPPTVSSMATIPDAIQHALSHLEYGNVLLIEEQSGYPLTQVFWPAEIDLACFDTISLATALGIVVVEAAGNRGPVGGITLDTYVDPLTGQHTLFRDPTNVGIFKDSGAIMVAAAPSAKGPAPLYAHAWQPGYGNYGQRIDCYAWGENVYTSTSADATDVSSYTCFDGTSAAAAIIAGVALSVQGMAEAAYGVRYSPRQMQQILSDPANGTPHSGAEYIGVMPDLQKIAAQVLNVLPDVYMRDFVGDLGGQDTIVGSSPDIILRSSPAAIPQDAFGPTSGTENDYAISVPAVPGFDHYVYVRLLNRGAAMVTNVDVTVYYSEPSTLITPAMWTLIGTTTVPAVLAGRQLAVSNQLLWPAADIPAPGHYCFIAVADHPQDPAPPLPPPVLWDQFVTWVGNNNNVGWRNFDVVSPDLLTNASDVTLPFFVKGEPDHGFRMELQVVAHLPFGSTLGIELPIPLLRQLGLFSRQLRVVDGNDSAILPINPNGTSRLLQMTYEAGWRLQTALRVFIPPAFRENTYDIFARQLYQGKEVGRVTWRMKRTRQHRTARPTNVRIT